MAQQHLRDMMSSAAEKPQPNTKRTSITAVDAARNLAAAADKSLGAAHNYAAAAALVLLGGTEIGKDSPPAESQQEVEDNNDGGPRSPSQANLEIASPTVVTPNEKKPLVDETSILAKAKPPPQRRMVTRGVSRSRKAQQESKNKKPSRITHDLLLEKESTPTAHKEHSKTAAASATDYSATTPTPPETASEATGPSLMQVVQQHADSPTMAILPTHFETVEMTADEVDDYERKLDLQYMLMKQQLANVRAYHRSKSRPRKSVLSAPEEKPSDTSKGDAQAEAEIVIGDDAVVTDEDSGHDEIVIGVSEDYEDWREYSVPAAEADAETDTAAGKKRKASHLQKDTEGPHTAVRAAACTADCHGKCDKCQRNLRLLAHWKASGAKNIFDAIADLVANGYNGGVCSPPSSGKKPKPSHPTAGGTPTKGCDTPSKANVVVIDNKAGPSEGADGKFENSNKVDDKKISDAKAGDAEELQGQSKNVHKVGDKTAMAAGAVQHPLPNNTGTTQMAMAASGAVQHPLPNHNGTTQMVMAASAAQHPLPSDSVTTQLPKYSHHRTKRPPVFPKRLYDILENAEEGGYSHLISWMPDGKAFRIHCDNGIPGAKGMDEFLVLIKTKFSMSRFKSFLRQLQVYGFHRAYKGRDRGICRHGLLVRGERSRLDGQSIQDFQNYTHATAHRQSQRASLISSNPKPETTSAAPVVRVLNNNANNNNIISINQASAMPTVTTPLINSINNNYSNSIINQASATPTVNSPLNNLIDKGCKLQAIATPFGVIAVPRSPPPLPPSQPQALPLPNKNKNGPIQKLSPPPQQQQHPPIAAPSRTVLAQQRTFYSRAGDNYVFSSIIPTRLSNLVLPETLPPLETTPNVRRPKAIPESSISVLAPRSQDSKDDSDSEAESESDTDNNREDEESSASSDDEDLVF